MASGQRNAALNLGAFNIFQIVYGNPGLLDEAMVRQRLFEAAEKCGLVADDGADGAWRTIDSGAAGAQAQPRARPLARLEGPKLGMTGVAPPAATAQAPDTRRIIQLVEGNEHHAIDEAEEALIQAGGFDIYQRAGILIRPVLEHAHAADNRATVPWRLSSIKLPFLLEMLARVAVFTVYDKRSKAWVPRKCPQFVGEMLAAREGVWRVPVVLGIVHTPQFRPDGTLAMAQGYDVGSRLLFKPDGEIFPALPDNPTRNDAVVALKLLDEAISTLPFKTAVDRSAALSLLLTALCRRALDHAPLHAITAPTAGTGKSMLVDLASILLSGQDAPVMAPGKNEEEAEKRLGAALLGGDAIIAFDNCTAALSGTLLCQALTQHRVRVRILGQSLQIGVPVSALFTATGNNLTIEGDLTRRALLCELDAGVACPELRKFDFNLKTRFRERRAELVAAGLTVLRAGRVAKLKPILTPLGGFEMWSTWVRDILGGFGGGMGGMHPGGFGGMRVGGFGGMHPGGFGRGFVGRSNFVGRPFVSHGFFPGRHFTFFPHRRFAFFAHRRFAAPFFGIGALYAASAYSSCWTWVPTSYGWQRVWACDSDYGYGGYGY